MRGIERAEIREGRGCKGEGRKVTGHKPSSVAEIVLYASLYMYSSVRARASIYFRIRTVARVILAQYEAEVVYCLLRTFKVT